MKRNSLSIIIPSFNAASLIERCIKSIVDQSYQNKEILVIDGGSTDGTLAILKKLRKQYTNLSFVSESDQGIYDAMNKGASMASGEWLYFLGSDDYLYESIVLEKIFSDQALIKHDVIYGDVWNEHIQGRYAGKFDYEKLTTNFMCHQAIFYRKSVFEKYGGYNIKYKVYAHIAFDVEAFCNPHISWVYTDTIVAFYSAGGYSAVTYDKPFWDNAEALFKKSLGKYIENRMIYSALVPILKYDFSLRKVGVLARILFYTRNFSFLKYPIHKYYRIGVLTLRKLS